MVFVAGISILVLISCIVFFIWLAGALIVDVVHSLRRRDKFIKHSELKRDSITPDIRDFKRKIR